MIHFEVKRSIGYKGRRKLIFFIAKENIEGLNLNLNVFKI